MKLFKTEPKLIRIIDEDFELHFVSNDEVSEQSRFGYYCDGIILFDKSEIWISNELSPVEQRKVLWHEIYHAGIRKLGLRHLTGNLKKHEEAIVDAMALTTTMVLRDNPWLGEPQ